MERPDEQRSSDARTSLAQWLRSGRAQRGMSLEDVARVTKIQPRILERLEAGKADGLPAEVFVRGFVRSFARCVGLDESEALVRFEACNGAERMLAQGSREIGLPRELAREPAREPREPQRAEQPRARGSIPPIAEDAPAATPPVVRAIVEAMADLAPNAARAQQASDPAPAAAPAAATAAAPEAPAKAAGRRSSKKKRGARRASAKARKRAVSAVGTPAEPTPVVAAELVEPAEAASPVEPAEPRVAAAVAEPEAVEPAQPELAEPELAEPELAEQVAAEPVVAEPVAAEPAAAEPAVAEPVAAEPAAAEPVVAEPIPEAPVSADEAWQPRMPPPPPPRALPVPPWATRPAVAPRPSASAPSLVAVIDDADPDSAERALEERRGDRDARRTFLPPILLDREDRRQGGLTLAVIILLIAATLTLSYLMRRPSSSGEGVTAAPAASLDVA